MMRLEPDALYSRRDIETGLKGSGLSVETFLARLKPRKVFRGLWWGRDLLTAYENAEALVEAAHSSDCDQSMGASPQRAGETAESSSAAEQTNPAPDIQLAQATGLHEVLARHNQLRSQHCVPALAWSEQLAQIAQNWADRCVFEHSSGNLGENLAMGTSGAYPPVEHVQSWYDEVASYDFARAESRDGKPVGHFTQIVWQSTTQLGCGVATCGGEDLLVCNYAPAGNFIGAYQQNVLAHC